MRKLLWIGGAALALVLGACQQGRMPHGGRPATHDDYKGYKMAPYTVRGNRFVPMGVEQALRYNEVGKASWYEADGAQGAICQKLYEGELYAAHRTLPLPCDVRITSLTTGKSCVARVADRGPFIHGRLIDVSTAVARELGFEHAGLDTVRVEVLSVGDGAYKRTK
ncbi:MAG: hypothetical protein II349_03285 [Akkermansia sp.]|nr:hypothetical protein [Akkermansia sp.]